VVQPGPLAPGQVGVTQEQYTEIEFAQLNELWTNYGDLFEVWFDGAFLPAVHERLAALIRSTQPHSNGFNGFGVSPNPVRWIGTESGHSPYPTWSTCDDKGCFRGGAGSPNGNNFVPPEVDCTLQNGDTWFYDGNVGVRPLQELISMYHDSVGHNGNLLLDMAPTTEGVLPPEAVERYKQLGDFIRGCYGSSLNATSGVAAHIVLLFVPPIIVDRAVLQEDQRYGQRVRNYTLSILTSQFIQREGAGQDGDGEDIDEDVDTLPRWQSLLSGSAIGHKKIDLFSSGFLTHGLRLDVQQSVGVPHISNFAAFDCTLIMANVDHES